MMDELTESAGSRCAAPFRVGLVIEQDPARARVRVQFPDRSEVISYWLAVVVPKSQDDKVYWMPDLGEQVVCLMDERFEDGAVLGAIYSALDMPPVGNTDKFQVTFRDGTVLEYDRAAHALSVALTSHATMSIAANGAKIAIDSSGNVTITAGGTINLGAGALKGVARLGDQVTVNDPESGPITGTITSASSEVLSG